MILEVGIFYIIIVLMCDYGNGYYKSNGGEVIKGKVNRLGNWEDSLLDGLFM